MILHGYWRSTATWRVRIALAYKGVEHTVHPIDLNAEGGDQHRPEHRRRNPMAQVPVLELEAGDDPGAPAFLGQSLAILEYLEDRFPSPPLLPGDPLGRARARQLAEIVNSGIQPLQNTGVVRHLESLGVESAAWIRRHVGRGLAAFEEVAAPIAGRFSVGDQLSFADLVLIPELAFARRFGIDLGGAPTLLRIEAACLALPCFAAADPLRQPDAPREPAG
ncbi:MAG: maleylacetoacetate isomerase [Myxococcales bacterium]|nr:maleylacetoacetate isomerase [Myxococcales bacterium]